MYGTFTQVRCVHALVSHVVRSVAVLLRSRVSGDARALERDMPHFECNCLYFNASTHMLLAL